MSKLKKCIAFLAMLALLTAPSLLYHEQRLVSKDITESKDNINFNFQDEAVSFKHPVYIYFNRYYLPAADAVTSLHGNINMKGNNLYLKLNNSSAEINTAKNIIVTDSRKAPLRNPLRKIENVTYMSLIDFTSLFNITTSWNYASKTISLYHSRDNLKRHIFNLSGRPAYIRLEDISVRGRYDSADALEKLRIVGDFLYTEGVPFHVGWIPRYIIPQQKIDIDLSRDYSMYNADFLFTLDYLINRGGLIGLHGYTHQHGIQATGSGIEFDKHINDDPSSVRQRIRAALAAAKALNIPVSFFETPHYRALYVQHKVMEEYFNYLYEPFDGEHFNNIYIMKAGGRTVRYIPTPLRYVYGSTYTDDMIKKVDSLKKDILGSFYYHPALEFSFIKLIKKKGTDYPYYIYQNSSPLHRILDAFKKDGFKFQRITSN